MKRFLVTSMLTLALVASTLFGGNLKAFDVNNTAVAAAATVKSIKITSCADSGKATVIYSGTYNADINEIINSVLKGKTSASTPTQAPTQTPAQKSTQEPTQTHSAATPSSSDNYDSSFASQVLKLVNIERVKGGLSELTLSQSLVAPANKRAQEIVQSFSHTRPNGTAWSTVLDEYNVSVSAAGENLAYGYNTPEAVVEGWMGSQGHRANIMNANFHKIGIGVYKDSKGTVYCTQLFSN